VPPVSLAAQPETLEKSRGSLAHDRGVWFGEPCEEIALASDQYDFTISLLHLGPVALATHVEEDETEDAFDAMTRRLSGDLSR